MIKQTITKDVFVSEDAREFNTEAQAQQHEKKLYWFSDKLKSYQVNDLHLDKEYHTVFIENVNDIKRKNIGDAFSLVNPENIVDGWNLITDNKKESRCDSIEQLMEKKKIYIDERPMAEPTYAPQETKNLTEFKGKLQRLVTRYNTDPAVKNMSAGAILGGLLIDLDLLLINN